MITYLCGKCGMDFAVSDAMVPKCFYCGAKTGYRLIKKQKITPQVIAERLKRVTDRMMENLRKAYGVRPADFDEDKLLAAMAKADKLRKNVQGLKLKQPKPSKQ